MGSPRRFEKAGWFTWWRYREKRLSSGLTADGEESLLLVSHTQSRGGMRRTRSAEITHWTGQFLTSTGRTGTCWTEWMRFLWIGLQDSFFNGRLIRWHESGICDSGHINIFPVLLSVSSRQKRWPNTRKWPERVPFCRVYSMIYLTNAQIHSFVTSFVLFEFHWSPVFRISNYPRKVKRKYYAPLSQSHIGHRTIHLSSGEEIITILTPLNSLDLPLVIYFSPREGCRNPLRCSLPWSMARSSAATPTSCACHGRAGYPKARRRSRCAGSATTRRAGSLLGTAEELSGSRLLPATADGTDPLRKE